mmetsp:Transcript_22546/g.28913  ORF Transcript_22546/g.28913 Transcript_22546/m.28913 type:complete len:88 (-) Transcript_22546:535-798(-)
MPTSLVTRGVSCESASDLSFVDDCHNVYEEYDFVLVGSGKLCFSGNRKATSSFNVQNRKGCNGRKEKKINYSKKHVRTRESARQNKK